MRTDPTVTLDLIGVGAGPSNLSLAALLAPVPGVEARFFERREAFAWHPGLLFPEATIQVVFLKDLVTFVDPTSRFSFLAFLAQAGRLYRFVHANFPYVERREFAEYFAWVARQLPSIRFSTPVEAITFDDGFVVRVGRGVLRARHVVLGTGITPEVPACARPHLGDTLFHSATYVALCPPVQDRRVVVIGGGQSGAEVVLRLLSRERPRSLDWVSRRWNFLPLDDSPFVNELFTPQYNDYFAGLSADVRCAELERQRLAGDGISRDLLAALHRRLYELQFLEPGAPSCRLRPGRQLEVVEPAGDAGWHLVLHHQFEDKDEHLDADVVVLCTGYARPLPACVEPLARRIRFEGGAYIVADDFSIQWDGPPGHKIFVQNAAMQSRGIADAHLSLMAWRSGRIINSVCGRRVYPTGDERTFVHWAAEPAAPGVVDGVPHLVA